MLSIVCNFWTAIDSVVIIVVTAVVYMPCSVEITQALRQMQASIPTTSPFAIAPPPFSGEDPPPNCKSEESVESSASQPHGTLWQLRYLGDLEDEHVEIGPLLGRGGFGRVYKGEDRSPPGLLVGTRCKLFVIWCTLHVIGSVWVKRLCACNPRTWLWGLRWHE